MPTPRTEVAVAELNGEIWVIVGYEDTNPGEQYSIQRTNIVEIYDPVKDSWRTGPAFPEDRAFHAAAALNGKIYVSGGEIKSSSATGWAESYTLYSSSGGGWTRLNEMPYRRQNHAMVGYQGKLYILGGRIYTTSALDSDVEITNNVIGYDPATDLYTTIRPMLIQKWYHDAVQADGTIDTIGGSKDFYDTAGGNILDNTESGIVPNCNVLVDLDEKGSSPLLT